ncbi:MAG: hypothetical protein JSV86_03870 [Gemmatimonadota bacterium]|nr:MAG: hypothetical protein JSV86_03870 [Gemmatimonadota bacterium]
MSIRSALDQALTLIGVIIIVVPVTLLTESWIPLIIVMLGALMIGAGAWRLGTRLLPNRRVYLGLRSEVEFFIRLVRRLNSHALDGDDKAVEDLTVEMKESVDRMVSLAGQVSGQVSTT